MVKRWTPRKEPAEIKCEWCRFSFVPRRPWQRFCSDSHRVLASMKRTAVSEERAAYKPR